MTGQAIAEFAMLLPVLMALLLGMIGVGFLFLGTLRMQNGIDVLAQLAARGPGWEAAVPFEDKRVGCNADPKMPEIAHVSDDRLLLTWSCHAKTGWLFDGLTITVSSEAVIRADEVPAASPTSTR